MRLYATVTSERASKGQGGEYLEIDICGPNKFPVARLRVEWNGEKVIIEGNYDSYLANMYAESYKTKGEKQKGVKECFNCGDKLEPEGFCLSCRNEEIL